MKVTILALTAFVVAIAPLARAQEETTTPAPTPEATAPEKSPSPATNPSVSVTTDTSASPTPERRSSPAADKSSSPAAPSRASSPAKTTAASTNSAPPAAVMPTKKSTVEATLKDIEDKWEASIVSHDSSVAQAYLGNDYRGVSSKGKVLNKSSLLAEIKKDTDTYTSAKNGRMDVRVYGGHFAVVMELRRKLAKTKTAKRSTAAFGGRMLGWTAMANGSASLPKQCCCRNKGQRLGRTKEKAARFWLPSSWSCGRVPGKPGHLWIPAHRSLTRRPNELIGGDEIGNGSCRLGAWEC